MINSTLIHQQLARSSAPTAATRGKQKQEPASNRTKSTETRIRVGLIGLAGIERDSLSALINGNPNLECSGSWEGIEETFDVQSAGATEVVIVPGLGRLPNRGRTGKATGAPAIVVILRQKEAGQVSEAFARGALGCVSEWDNKDSLFNAIAAITRGDTYMSDSIKAAFTKALNMVGGRCLDLSGREEQIFEMLGQGKTTSAIALETQLSLKTVQAYCARIKEKRGYTNLHELVVAAARTAT